MKTLVTIAAFLALSVPAALAVPPTGHGNQGGQSGQGTTTTAPTTPSASQQCKEQRKVIGMKAFRLLYAQGGSPKAAMDTCLTKLVQVSSTQAKNAAMACKAERQLGVQAFNDKYGTNPNKRNAFGKCVSMKATQSANTQQQATENAAKTCMAERQLGVQAFNDKYGTNANKRNAFGKCVSKLASQKSSS